METVNPEMQLAGNVLDHLLGLSFMAVGADDTIMRCVNQRLTELRTCDSPDMLWLTFSKTRGDHPEEESRDHYLLEVDSLFIDLLPEKLAALRTLGFETIDNHAS